jgi:hypothetical protein
MREDILPRFASVYKREFSSAQLLSIENIDAADPIHNVIQTHLTNIQNTASHNQQILFSHEQRLVYLCACHDLQSYCEKIAKLGAYLAMWVSPAILKEARSSKFAAPSSSSSSSAALPQSSSEVENKNVANVQKILNDSLNRYRIDDYVQIYLHITGRFDRKFDCKK